MAHGRPRYNGREMADSECGPRVSFPVQTSEDTDVKQPGFPKIQNELQSLDSGFSSMRLNSSGYSSMTLSYNPADTDNVYNMGHPQRGVFAIINNRVFNAKTGMAERRGTDVDAANLYTTFKKLGFEVQLKNNMTCQQMLRIVIDYSEMDHSKADCFAMAILSHGAEGVVYGTDGTMEVKKLVEPLKRCKSLVGKPKFFIVQACRGEQFDEGVDVTDAEVSNEPYIKPCRLPKEADFLYAYSTSPGFHAFRNSSKGSVYISEIAKAFQELGPSMEVVRLLTRVNRAVAFDFESQAATPAFSQKKQMPSFESVLTKELYFPPKQ